MTELACDQYKCLAHAQLQEACGLAFDFGRERGALELQRVLCDAEMMRNCDDRAREEIERLRVRVAKQQRSIDLIFGAQSLRTRAGRLENILTAMHSGEISPARARDLLAEHVPD